MSQSPTGDFLLGSAPLEEKGDRWRMGIVSIPHGGFFVGKSRKRDWWRAADRCVSIPHGGFFVGKSRKRDKNCRRHGCVSIPHGGFFVGKLINIKVPVLEGTRSQSPTGDFLLGSLPSLGSVSPFIVVSIPHGGFFVGKREYDGALAGRKESQSPTGDFLLGSSL